MVDQPPPDLCMFHPRTTLSVVLEHLFVRFSRNRRRNEDPVVELQLLEVRDETTGVGLPGLVVEGMIPAQEY